MVAAQAALSTAGLIFASAALGLVGGRRMASSEDASGFQSASDNLRRALHVPAPSSRELPTSSVGSIGAPSSRHTVSMQTASAETAQTTQEAEDRSVPMSSQSDSRDDPSSFPAAEQLWERAWKAFEEPEQKQGLSRPETQPGTLAGEQQLDSQPQSSFPSLAARFFGSRSAPQDRR